MIKNTFGTTIAQHFFPCTKAVLCRRNHLLPASRCLCWERESQQLRSEDDSNAQWLNWGGFNLPLTGDRCGLSPIDTQRISRCVCIPQTRGFLQKGRQVSTNTLHLHKYVLYWCFFSDSPMEQTVWQLISLASILKDSSFTTTSCSMTLINNSQAVWVLPPGC